mgnify:FL=1
MSRDAHDSFAREVLELHRFLEQWLKGEVPPGDTIARLENALDEDFQVVHPDGSRAGKREVVDNFRRAYGTKGASYRLEISGLVTRPLAGHCHLATYREDHLSEPGRSRISSAVLCNRDDRTSWIFLQETLIARA